MAHVRTLLSLFLMLGSGAAGLSACGAAKDQEGRISSSETAQKAAPAVKVNLPPPPAFDKPLTPVQHPDGSYSVYGLRQKVQTLLDQDVRVTGYVTEVYRCPCAAKDKECLCRKPHFFIADKKDGAKESALMVVDQPTSGAETKLLVAGTRVIVSGTFVSNSLSGFSASDGLIAFKSASAASLPD